MSQKPEPFAYEIIYVYMCIKEIPHLWFCRHFKLLTVFETLKQNIKKGKHFNIGTAFGKFLREEQCLLGLVIALFYNINFPLKH